MMKLVMLAYAAIALMIASPVNAQVITFDEIATGVSVNSFYNGGGGPNYGVDFLSGDWTVLSGFGETSQPNFAYSQSGSGYFNVASGFTGTLSFTYGAFTNFTGTVFDGLNGTGTALGTVTLFANDTNAFSSVSLAFLGTAQSFMISGGGGQFGFDDVTINAVSAVPEPSIWATMLIGFGFVGGALRYRRRRTSISFG